jgi:hypothetical protein
MNLIWYLLLYGIDIDDINLPDAFFLPIKPHAEVVLLAHALIIETTCNFMMIPEMLPFFLVLYTLWFFFSAL